MFKSQANYLGVRRWSEDTHIVSRDDMLYRKPLDSQKIYWSLKGEPSLGGFLNNAEMESNKVKLWS